MCAISMERRMRNFLGLTMENGYSVKEKKSFEKKNTKYG